MAHAVRALGIAALLALGVVAPARAQSIDACDIAWLDTLRLRAVLRVELASMRPAAHEGVTFVVGSCTATDAEVRIERDGAVVERRVVVVGDVPASLRTRLLALVLAELVRVSTGLESQRDDASEPMTADARIPAPPAPSPPAAASPPRASRTAAPEHAALLEDRPPFLQRDQEDRPPPYAPEAVDDPASHRDDRTSLTFDSGIRWYPREWSRLLSLRGRVARQHLVVEARYSRGPTLYTESELPSTFSVAELAAGPRVGVHGAQVDFDVAALAAVGFVRPLADEGDDLQSYDRTPCYALTLSFTATRSFGRGRSRAVLVAGFDIGYFLGTASSSTIFRDEQPVGDMRGVTFGLSVGVGYGAVGAPNEEGR